MIIDRLLGALDRFHARCWRYGIRFHWPLWFLDWAWDRNATPGPGELDRLARRRTRHG